ncbi:hypothetical protein [Spirillospora sp. NPDC047279]|uniref:hypothetical protein n=1 Tax=Spirillospora sp. NPDC047279 TaxID=3155478 RepID=UPI003410DE10
MSGVIEVVGRTIWGAHESAGETPYRVEYPMGGRRNEPREAFIAYERGAVVLYVHEDGRFGTGDLSADGRRITTFCRRPGCDPRRCRKEHMVLSSGEALDKACELTGQSTLDDVANVLLAHAQQRIDGSL